MKRLNSGVVQERGIPIHAEMSVEYQKTTVIDELINDLGAKLVSDVRFPRYVILTPRVNETDELKNFLSIVELVHMNQLVIVGEALLCVHQILQVFVRSLGQV